MPVRWLFLDMNAFFASVEQQIHPELRGRPVAVVPLLSDSTSCIAASYEAKAYGVKTGTNVREARRLCPNIRLVEARHAPYREFHDQIVGVVQENLPIDKILSVDEMACRLWANERELSDAMRLAEHIKGQIKTRVGEWMHCSMGLGPNSFLAKVAAEMQKPNGLSVLDEEDLPQKLYGLKLTDFPGIARSMEARFHRAGVHTTEQMYGLTAEQMRRVWGGVNGEHWWHLLRGHRVAEPPIQRRSVGHSHVLPPALRSPWGASAVAGRLLEKAAERMRGLGCGARAISVYQRGPDGQVWRRQARLSLCGDTSRLMETLCSLWEHPFSKPRQVSVVLWDLALDSGRTLSLFAADERRRAATQAVDSINNRFGRGTITLASVLPVLHTAEEKIAFGKVH